MYLSNAFNLAIVQNLHPLFLVIQDIRPSHPIYYHKSWYLSICLDNSLEERSSANSSLGRLCIGDSLLLWIYRSIDAMLLRPYQDRCIAQY